MKKSKFEILILTSFIVLYTSCLTNRNTFKQVRVNKSRFSIKSCNDPNVDSKIDTSAIYMLIDKDNTIGIKFYGGNKVAYFTNIDLERTESLNPEKGSMGIYNTCSEKKLMQFAFYHVQSGTFISKSEFKIKNDTLIDYTLPSAKGGNFELEYVKTKLNSEQLIYKPDW